MKEDGVAALGHVRPLVGVVCCGSAVMGRRMQAVSETFLAPVAASGGSALLVPAMESLADVRRFAGMFDALLLTGAPSNVAPLRYGSSDAERDADHERDHVALGLAERMIALGRPVLGICRGMQELNVAYGGTLRDLGDDDRLHMVGDWRFPAVFRHSHDMRLVGSRLRELAGRDRAEGVSAHRQGVALLGSGLTVEALAEDGLVEAFSAEGGRVVGVQWHPERGESEFDRALFLDLMRAA